MARLRGFNSRPRSSAVRSAFLALTCALIAPPSVAASRAQIVPAVANAALSQLNSKAAKALSIAVVLGDKIVGSETFGDADAATAFSVGSVSKMFTAVSILQLVQAGKIALDGVAAKYLPQYPSLRDITIRQLLSHTSGLPNYADDAIATGAAMQKTTPADIISSMLARPPDFAPGSDWSYSNTGYVVLGQIVENVSGMPLAQYESEHIFRTVGMEHTFVAPALAKDVAGPFDGDPGDWTWYYACGDVFSTADDLARFDIALMRGELLRPKTFATMQQTVPFTTFAPGMRDGLGVFVSTVGDVFEVGHHGGEPGYRADNEMVPELGFAVAVVGNGNYNTAPIVAQALHEYLGANLQAPLPAGAYVDGAPAVTQRLKALLIDLGSGRDDRSQMEILAAIGVPGIVDQMRANGPVTSVRFLSKLYTSSGVLYRYEVLFRASRAVLTAVIDKSDKLAQLQMLTLPSRAPN
jgi:D-alanyl-D-alanine carboxypeptidase